jgi:murein DD-endopeptidase MepM/ murein hydrolase activator NlpD
MRSFLFFIVAILISATTLLWAKQIYSWTDANGIKHFSDQPPPSVVPAAAVQKRLVSVDPKPAVRLRDESEPGLVRYFAYNNLAGPMSVRVDLEGAAMQSTPVDLSMLVVPPQREVALFEVRPIGAGGEFRLRYRSTPGAPDAVPDAKAIYQLPFAADQSFAVHQGFGGSYSHQSPESFYAVDIALPLGTEVLASRAGVVMQVEKDFFGSGTDLQKFGERANFVTILHADGTMATYAHLDLESVAVGVGQRVAAGDRLGRSGNTGFSTGPHLHFVVQHNDRGVLRSLPMFFTHANRPQVPITGVWLGQSEAAR